VLICIDIDTNVFPSPFGWYEVSELSEKFSNDVSLLVNVRSRCYSTSWQDYTIPIEHVSESKS
jgi:hypothetical protein